MLPISHSLCVYHVARKSGLFITHALYKLFPSDAALEVQILAIVSLSSLVGNTTYILANLNAYL